jgi:hypothetical protein
MADTSTQFITSDSSDALSHAKQLLERGELKEAISALEGSDAPAGAAAALRGAAYYRLEQYGRAAEELKKALSDTPADVSLRKLYDRALANDVADVKRHVPEPVYLDAGSLAGGPKPGDHPASNKPPLTHDEKTALFKAIGIVIGEKFGHTLGLLTKLLGKEPPSKSPWTSWYQQSFLRGTVMLARRRERLNREQLFAAYPKHEGTGFFRGKVAPEWARSARSADGSWNDLKEPMAGAANTRFGSNTDPTKTVPETGERLLTPNPRMVSRKLLTRKDGFKPIPCLNLTGAAWIQFMNHDWVSYGDPANAEPYRIPLAEDDPARKALHQTHLLVRPTQKDPTRRPGEPQTHINEVTSWWDGSQIYGSDAKTIDALRSHRDGKLALDPKTNNLPVLPDGVEHTGFRRNWWLGLSMLHVLFVREHNAICDMLAVRYPHFSDQRLFDTARLINAAVMAKIHTVEWTTAVLANKTLNAAMNANWYGFLTNALRSKSARRTLAEINVADPVAGGLVGNSADNHDVPYSLTREFVSVYRLHSLLPDQISLYALGENKQPLKTWGLAELRQAAAHRVTDSLSMTDLFYSFGIQNAGQLVLNNFPETLQNLSIPGAGFYDLGAVDVLRDRERGVPRYNQFRRLMGMKPLESIDDLSDDLETTRALKQVYAGIEDVDLLIGNLAESRRPTGFGFGETLFEVFILNASRRLQADRFFTDSFREDIYTAEGLAWIDEVTLKKVILRHFPDLARTGLANVDNAFEPWDVGPLDEKRHPLRQFDEGLRELDDKARLQL